MLTAIFMAALTMTARATTFNGACILIPKFHKEGRAHMGSEIGPHHAELQFQDAVYSADLPPLYDGAALFYLTDHVLNHHQSNLPPLKAAYRLSLASGETDTILLYTQDHTRLVAFTDQILISYQAKISRELIRQEIRRLQPKLKNRYFISDDLATIGMIRVMNITQNLKDLEILIEIIQKHYQETAPSLGASVSLNHEMYRSPFRFGPLHPISSQEFAVDLDPLRVITKPLAEQQKMPFITPSSRLPSRLKCP